MSGTDAFPLRSLRPLIVTLFPGQKRHLEKVKKMRESLANELSEVINEYAPKIWDDFDYVRIYNV